LIDEDSAKAIWKAQVDDNMRMRLQKLNPTTEPEYDGLFNELVTIDGELRRLRHGTPDPA
jgi:hypothetical protein